MIFLTEHGIRSTFTNEELPNTKHVLSNTIRTKLDFHTGYRCVYCAQTVEDCGRYGCEDC